MGEDEVKDGQDGWSEEYMSFEEKRKIHKKNSKPKKVRFRDIKKATK